MPRIAARVRPSAAAGGTFRFHPFPVFIDERWFGDFT